MNLIFTKSDNSDIPKLKRLWADCFVEKEHAVDLFFDKNFDNLSAYSVKAGDLTVSALYLIHGRMNGQKAHYLCGAATLPKYRRLGIMSELIEYALNDAAKNGDVYSLLFPASEELYSFYEKFGYSAACTARKIEMSRQQLENFSINKANFDSFLEYEQMQLKCFKNNFLLQNNNFIEFAAEYYAVYGVRSVRGNGCFALIDEYDDCADIFYSVYTDFDELKSLLLDSTNAEQFVFTGKSDNKIFENVNSEKYGMIKSLDNKIENPDDVFIGITLN